MIRHVGSVRYTRQVVYKCLFYPTDFVTAMCIAGVTFNGEVRLFPPLCIGVNLLLKCLDAIAQVGRDVGMLVEEILCFGWVAA